MTLDRVDLREGPPRSLLFVPGDRAVELLDKADRSGADAIILDLEDAVGIGQKESARASVCDALGATPARRPVYVRINPPSSQWFDLDIRAVATLPIAGLLLPRCDGPEAVAGLMAAWTVETDRPASIVVLIESARGVLAAAEIAVADPAVVGLAFGAEDLAAQVGLVRTRSGSEILYARSHVVLAAAAGGRWAIDTPCLEIQRLDVVRREARVAATLGFAGKLVIHPAQVEPVHEAFRPTADEIARARRTIEEAETLATTGRGVGTVEGRMIDRPVVEAARRILARADGAPIHDEATYARR